MRWRATYEAEPEAYNITLIYQNYYLLIFTILGLLY